MPATPWTLFHATKVKLLTGEIDLDDHDMKVALMASTWEPDLAEHALWADISEHEIAEVNGYAATALMNPTVTDVAGMAVFTADNPNWMAEGGSIVCRFAVIYIDSLAGKDLLCYSLLNDAPDDITVVMDNLLSLNFPSTGIFRAI